MSQVADNLSAIEGRIRAACQRAERAREDVTLVAVSKRQPLAAVKEAIACGLTVFGENHAQDLERRREALPTVRWDFLGRVQRNKVRYLVPGTGLIHSVASERVAETLHRRGEREGEVVDVLVQVDTGGGGGQRNGVPPEALGGLARAVTAYKHVALRGLMVFPPASDNEDAMRAHFQHGRRLLEELRQALSLPLRELSMGMSADFDVAIEEGATLVRIGSALFGPRPEAA